MAEKNGDAEREALRDAVLARAMNPLSTVSGAEGSAGFTHDVESLRKAMNLLDAMRRGTGFSRSRDGRWVSRGARYN